MSRGSYIGKIKMKTNIRHYRINQVAVRTFILAKTKVNAIINCLHADLFCVSALSANGHNML